MRARNAALFFIVTALAGGVSVCAAESDVAGMVEGEDSHFQITNSDYLNINLDSTEVIKLRMESVPEIITMRIRPLSDSATSTRLTFTGLVASTTYYKYEDNYHNLTPILSDENGAYTYTQDISKHHRVFIQPKKSTKFIVDDATGGDCSSIGTWDSETLTCTLTTDLAETVQIDSDGITLDGGRHTITGSHTGDGVYLEGRSEVTIKNLVVKDFSFGVYLYNSSSTTIAINTFSNNRQAISFDSSSANTISDNTIGIDIVSSRRYQGITFFDSNDNIIEGNSISMNNDNSPNRHQGVLFFDSFRNTVTGNTLAKAYQMLLLFDSGGNTIYQNNFINNGTHAIDYDGVGNTFNLTKPEGGNYFDTFDEPADGCDDADLDGFCDASYIFVASFNGGQDNLPWTKQNGWESSSVSNVLFLPGIEGSRLYEGTGCGKDAEEKLWEPIGESLWKILRGAGDKKVRSLFLNDSGDSICSDIYAKANDVIDSVRGSNIYKLFIDEMNGLKTSGDITDWKPVAYDWRLSLDDLMNRGMEIDGKIFYAKGDKSATSTPYIEQTLRALAASSKTGKVTIIAHSNGGLVAKALLNKLGGETPKLVDKVIMVGAPQSGAPIATGALLYGLDQGISYLGIPILHSDVAKDLAENSPMVYHLLPSQNYLNSIAGDTDHPVASFAGDGYAKEISAYGATIDNTAELDDFMLSESLNSSLIDYANVQHSVLDSWTPQAGIEINQIAGWGADTVAGIYFYTPQLADALTALEPQRAYRPIFTEDGDGTVPVPSALMMASSTSVKRYWVNIAKINNLPGATIKYSHKNILEIPSLNDFIKNIIKNSTSTLPAYILTNQPSSTSDKKLTFFLHSPLTLQLTDSSGNTTGLAEDNSMTQDIPNSSYGEFGDVKYITVPQGSSYQITMHGQESGTFSLEIQETTGGIITASSTIASVPTTENTLASMTISDGINTASALTVDKNGDGANIITITPKVGDTVTYVEPEPEPEPQAPSTSISTTISVATIPVAPILEPIVTSEQATTTPQVIATSTSIIATTSPEATPTSQSATQGTGSASKKKPHVAIVKPRETTITPASHEASQGTAQTASVYDASQQPFLAHFSIKVYNILNGFISVLKNLF